MRFLLLGFLTGAICALVALALGARWWMILLTYAIAGTLGTFANALWFVYGPARTDELDQEPASDAIRQDI